MAAGCPLPECGCDECRRNGQFVLCGVYAWDAPRRGRGVARGGGRGLSARGRPQRQAGDPHWSSPDGGPGAPPSHAHLWSHRRLGGDACGVCPGPRRGRHRRRLGPGQHPAAGVRPGRGHAVWRLYRSGGDARAGSRGAGAQCGGPRRGSHGQSACALCRSRGLAFMGCAPRWRGQSFVRHGGRAPRPGH